jgi:cysteine desulfurase
MKPDFGLRDHEIYMDNAATTVVAEEVQDAMRPYFEERYGNPETVYRLGREASEAVESSRVLIADVLKCEPGELFFTSGGTESNNWAIKNAGLSKPGLIVGATEHASVLESARWRTRDLPYLELPVDQFGVIDLALLEKSFQDSPSAFGLVSIQYANNEIGTIQPVLKIAELCHKYGAIFHCDAVQALGKLSFDVDDIGADLISFSAHKIHGPMGMGALYVRKGTSLEPLLHGGGQERGMRSGTLAVPEIVGFAKAVEMAEAALPKEMPRLMAITEWLASQLCQTFKAKRNGHPTQRLPNIVNVTIPDMETEVVCGIMCSKYSTCLSAGAACSTAKRSSHVLEAIGQKSSDVLSSFRFSLSRYNSDSDVRVAFCRLQESQEAARTRGLL